MMRIPTAVAILKIASLSMLGFAAIWALAPYDPVNTPAIWLVDLLDWPFDGNPSQLGRYDQWFSAIASAFLFGYALLFLLLICPLIEEGNRRARKAALISLGVWFVSDSLGSVAAGVPVNVLWNILFLTPFAVPLLMVDLDSNGN